jgi:hypothetical protein
VSHKHIWIPGCGIDDCPDCWLVCDVCKVSISLRELQKR